MTLPPGVLFAAGIANAEAGNVADPYTGGADDVRAVLDWLRRGVAALAPRLQARDRGIR